MSYETELELTARRLEGDVIVRVTELHAWDTPGLLAIVLQLADRSVEVRWADELGLHHGFHVALRGVPGPDVDRGRVVDATDTWRAAGWLGEIKRASIEWGDVRADLRSGFAIGVAIHADYLRRRDYPRALVLRIGDRDLAIECRFTNALSAVQR